MNLKYDIIVIGAGHAGCEAAAAAANMNAQTLLITIDMTKFGQMSCNPAIGGIAKGQIVREIDALGGYTGIVTDKTTIQFRMLNKSKGPAMWSPRAQCDRTKFSIEWRKILESIPKLDLLQDEATELIIENNIVSGVKTKNGLSVFCSSVIITSGTFLNGKIHIGRTNYQGGRISEPANLTLSSYLKENGFEVGRMKTGTPVRIDGRSIDFSVLEEQKGDTSGKFSFEDVDRVTTSNMSCYITYTNTDVHRILEKGFKDSPLYTGTIKGIGPRYCPSIEDKIVTFHEKDSHQLFLEPEGDDTNEFYLNGFSSSLPYDIQFNALRKIMGLERVKIYRPGYAIEYDYFPPTQLKDTLETKLIQNLYFAGQVNGTTGYEEAAAQGLIAGINAVLKLNSKDAFVLKRDESYIGVLIDDLITKGVDEPYRMFTSRAEYRILLRQDNADDRLTEMSFKIGLASKERYDSYKLKYDKINKLYDLSKTIKIKPETVSEYLEKSNTTQLKESLKLIDIIIRPQVSFIELFHSISFIKEKIISMDDKIDDEILELTELKIKYEGYEERERILADKSKRLEEIKIPSNISYRDIKQITIEARQKLEKVRPNTLGQASRIPGVSPSDINILLLKFGR